MARVDRAALVDSVKRVSLVAERNTPVQLAFTDGCSPSTPAPARRHWPPRRSRPTSTGEDITTGFNPQFLLDGLTALESPFVELAFTQACKPAVISGVDCSRATPDADFRYLLMPRRLLS